MDLGCGVEILKQRVSESVNLARAVRISGDGGQEERHLAKEKKKGTGLGSTRLAER